MKKLLVALALSFSLSLSFSFARAQDTGPGAATPPAATPIGQRSGTVMGQLLNGTAGGAIPGNLTMMLHAWDDNGETVMLDGTADAGGAFRFEDVPMQDGWVFAAMAGYNDVTFFSEQATVEPGLSELTLPLTVYETTTDASAVRVGQLHLFLDYVGGEVEVSEVYVLANTGDRVVQGTLSLADGRGATLQFALPAGANEVTFQANGDNGRFSMVDETHFADTAPLQPGMGQAKVVVQYTLPYQSGMQLAHAVDYPVDGINIIQRADANVTLAGSDLSGPSTETMEGQSYSLYGSTAAGLALTLSGRPNFAAAEAAPGAAAEPGAASATASIERWAVPAAAAVLGLALVAAGVWWLRRSGPAEPHGEAPAGAPAEQANGRADWNALLVSIARLDEAHERGEVPEAEYGERRAALKAQARALLEVDEPAE
jgi:hypothetical protein